MFSFIKKRLSRKILSILALSLALPMILVIGVSVYFQSQNILREMTVYGDELAHSIYAGIKYPMSVGDNDAVRMQLFDVSEKLHNVDVYITDHTKKIIYGTDRERINSRIDSTICTEEKWQGLLEKTRAGKGVRDTCEHEIGGTRYLTTLLILPNQEECHRCHGTSQDVLGSLIVRMDTTHTHDTISSQTSTVLLFGSFAIVIVIAVAYAMLSSQVTLPLTRLEARMKDLPQQIGANETEEAADSLREDEIGSLVSSFNEMTRELREKSRLIDKTNEELSSTNRELEAFAYSVSHDLRAPLRNIDGFSKILLDEYHGQLDDTGRHYLNRVRNGTTRMSQLIDDMLSFSRAGRIELEVRTVDANLLIKEVMKDFSTEIQKRNMRVEVKELPRITCDTRMISQVFANLLSNAIKYTREIEHPELTVYYDTDSRAICFQDNGIGFEEQYHDRIFQVFQRLQLPEQYEGTGIGLAIAKRIVERHHGKIWAESEPGRGAVFYVHLPEP